MPWDMRHHCPEADAIARDGVAALLYDPNLMYPGWHLIHPDMDAWERWFDDRTHPDPLRFQRYDAYDLSLKIEYCPWCGMPLSEDSNLLAWLCGPTPPAS